MFYRFTCGSLQEQFNFGSPLIRCRVGLLSVTATWIIFVWQGGKRNRRVQMIGISHSGVRLLTRFKDQFKDYIEVLNYIRFGIGLPLVFPSAFLILICFVLCIYFLFYLGVWESVEINAVHFVNTLPHVNPISNWYPYSPHLVIFAFIFASF
jgi:hypothetical protein